MKNLVAGATVLALVAVGTAVAAEKPCGVGPRLAFSLSASQRLFHVSLAGGLELYAVRDTGGWELQVFKVGDRHRRDNLLYPAGNWHGAYQCQIQPGVGRDTFPDERILPIRATERSLCVRLIDTKVGGEGKRLKYTGGRVEIRADGA